MESGLKQSRSSVLADNSILDSWETALLIYDSVSHSVHVCELFTKAEQYFKCYICKDVFNAILNE